MCRNLTLQEVLTLEYNLRPNENIGWNLQKGGNLGVDSSWYDVKENKERHSTKTSEGTKRGIFLKDSTEKRSERAKLNWINNVKSYIGKQTGSKNGRAQLNEEQVRNIKCNLIPNSYQNEDIAKMYGVKAHVISFIKSGKNWKHIVCDSPDHE